MGVIRQKYKKYLGANPYKGFVPFIGNYELEHSMEFFYLPLNSVLITKNIINWDQLEKKLNEVSSRNHTAIIRFYLDYPTLETGIPEYLINENQLIHYDEFGGGFEINYNNEFLINELIKFIKNFGLNYDGDERIAFVECGLIGHWGEWHCYPNELLMPNLKFQEEIIREYSKSFTKTKILFRYPKYKFLEKYNIGFHDDSFCYSTLPNKEYHFLSQMINNNLDKKYLNNPIGGEVRPEEQEKLILNKKTKEDYNECVNKTNCSWLICQEAFLEKQNKKIIQELSSQLGYDFYVDNVSIENNILTFELFNKGVAPIYYDFDCILIIEDFKNIIKLNCCITNILPNESYKFEYLLNKEQLDKRIYFALCKNNINIFLSNDNFDNNRLKLYDPFYNNML